MSKVFVENNNYSITNMFLERDWRVVTDLEEADLVCFEGGADVSPELYGQENTDSFSDLRTDWESIVLLNNALRLNKSIVGICRGGQFLNVMSGGTMIQHVDRHAISGTHKILVEGWDRGVEGSCDVTSTHHQMMQPGIDSDVVGWAGLVHDTDPEIIYHRNTGTLSFQPHPEYVDKDHECQHLFFDLLNEYFGWNL